MVPAHIHHTIYEPAGSKPKAVILLLHGMQEHSGRYELFANQLKANGYSVVSYDHVGHGLTAKTKEQLGFFHKNRPAELLVDDAERMATFTAARFAEIPLVLMGHSMGSFVARVLLARAPHRFAGAVLVGTGGPNPMAALFRPVLWLANQLEPKRRSRWLNGLFSKINNRRFRHEVPNDGTNWLSAGLENRKAFLTDSLCGVDFTNNAFYGLIALNVKATRRNWASGIPRTMPLLLISGAADPIGDFGKGVERTAKELQDRGFERVTLKCYPGMRHEVLNEDSRQVVFDDVSDWLDDLTTWGFSSHAQRDVGRASDEREVP